MNAFFTHDRFNAMLQTKSRLESEMIKNVTEKLSLKKSLLDVQIDNNKLIEDSETRSMEVRLLGEPAEPTELTLYTVN